MSKLIIALTFFLFAFISGTFVAVAQNPFLFGGDKEPKVRKIAKRPQILQKAFRKITSLQKQLRVKLTQFGREIRKNPYGRSFWLFMLFSFAYGVIHALGPGHGKSIAFSYFLSRPGNLFQGLLLGNLLTFIHVFSAVVIVIILYFVLKTSGMTALENVKARLENMSYALLILIGVFLTCRIVYELKSNRFGNDGQPRPVADMKSLTAVSLVTGIIPCSGAAIILLFSISLQILIPGLLAMFFVAGGMGITTSLVAVLAIVIQKTVFRISSRAKRAFTIVYATMAFTGSLAIMVIGALLLWSNI